MNNQNTQRWSRNIAALRKDVDLIKKTMATKDDLRIFATKDDLKNFATKDDLKNFVTNDKFNNLVTIVVRNSRDISMLLKDTAAIKKDVSVILDHIDHFVKKIDVSDKKAIVHDYRLNQLEPKVENHEARLAVLESRV